MIPMETMVVEPTQTLGTRTLRGMFWAYGSYVGGRLLVLVATAILARILSPADFGLVALALVFIEVLSTLRDLGVTQALVIVPDAELEDRADTVFTFSLVLGAALGLACAALSPLAALFFDAPELIGLLSALGVTFLVRALGSTHYAIAQKRMDFRSRTAAEMADATVRGVISVLLALAGLGAWSLVLGYIAGALALTAVMWALVPWRPRLRIVRAHLSSLLRFGGALTGVDIISATSQNIDYVFVGRVLGATQLGIYTIAFRIPDLLIKNLTIVASTVLFPAYAAVDRSALGAAFLTTVRYTVMLTLPVGVTLVVLAEPVIVGVFGPAWREAAPAMQVLVLYALLPAITTPAGTAYKAIGRADILLKLAIVRVPMLVGLLALFVERGIEAVAACMAGMVAIFFVVSMVIAVRLLHVRAADVWRAVAPAVVASAAAGAAALPAALLIDWAWPALFVGLIAAGVAYVAVLALLAPDSLRELRDRFTSKGISGRADGTERSKSQIGISR
jgi:lipopolysaccharide exporter